MQLLLRFLVGLCFFLNISAKSLGSESNQAELSIPSIAIIDFFPFGFTDNAGQPQGLFIEIAEVISKQLGQEFNIKLLPVPRALRGVSSGKIDMLISYKDPVMVPNVEFLGKLGCLTSYLIPSAKHKPQNLQQLDSLKVGYITGGYFDKRFSRTLNIQPVEVPSNEAMLTMLLRGRLDAFVINDAVYNAYLGGLNPHVELPNGWQNQVGKGFPIEAMETHLSISDYSKHKALSPKLKHAISQLFQQRKLKPIYEKYNNPRAECYES